MGSVFLFLLFLAMVAGGILLIRKRPRPASEGASKAAASEDKPAPKKRLLGSSSALPILEVTPRTPEVTAKKHSRTVELSMLASGWVFIVLGSILALTMCFSVVSPKNVGVVVTFGAVDSTTRDSGLNAKLPWANVVEIDGTIQTDEYENADMCIPVRIGDGSQACAYITNRWYINAEKGAAIYQDFRSDDPTQAFRSAVISTQLKASVQKALKDYNPIAQLEPVDGNDLATDLSFAPDYDAVSLAIEADMKERLSEDELAVIEGITFSYLGLAPNTQKKLDDYVAAIGETRIAMQREQTAQAQANANNTLSDSVSNDPNVLVSKCFDSVADAIAAGYQLPAGFSCWGGSGAVVIPGTSPAPVG